jgi:hypothetical protein
MGMKVSIGVAAALMLGMALWPVASPYQFLARGAICLVAFAAAVHAGRTDRNLWVLGLAGVALLFNPVAPVALAPSLMVWVIAACITTMVAWLFVLDRTVAAPSVADVLHPIDVTK